ncbi:hypothetical protein PVAND_006596 [Polypedilum vanderplanki]|uniref:PID domain-containing protein n=1 Tax=Polypedilum vanderplanki TaxID=319348 RepID=A0A9J6C3P8_POLVA|nr:hypothetical protein PVAND_006596 [Polypedilum vanderplanki]
MNNSADKCNKYRNEPARFFGDGVVFKAKLIGILEVGEARGDRMCQEALQDLKIAIRAAGEHKQRITIHVTIEGLRLRDEKSGESLYHHPVHKISFIAQDMTDSRAFGYIFGSPDCGHRFFGIKTDKAASQVVLAMRDLFQCVFELKKKEIELAKQHIQNRITAHEHQQIKSSILEHKKSTSLLNEATAITRPASKAEKSPEATANLVDLEQELSSIQRGITQMERITPNDDVPLTAITSTKNVLDDDPFGDSFTSFSSTTPFNILPPPTAAAKRSIISTKQVIDEDPISLGELSSITYKSTTPPILQSQPQQVSTLDSWLQSSSSTSTVPFVATTTAHAFKENDTIIKTDENSSIRSNSSSRQFQEDDYDNLDPLGKKSYVDKKYFFQDLKNPPKKVLKDLTSEQDSIFDAHFSPLKRKNEESLSSSRAHEENSQIIDPFEEEDFSKIVIDQLESTTTPATATAVSKKSIILPDTKINSITEIKSKNEEKSHEYKGFNVDLDADSSIYSTAIYTDLKRQNSDSSSKNVFSVDSLSKKLPKANLFGQRNVKRDSNGINMRRLQESDSLSEENEPELPPRLPDSEPPPLPPKNQMNQKDSTNELQSDRNRYSKTSSSTSRESGSRYDYANKFKSHSTDSPPIPLPSRKINRAETSRSSKRSNDDDDYLTPSVSLSSQNINSTIPQLPPPPPQKNTSKLRGTRKSETDPKNLDAPTPPVSAKADSSATAIIPDITLSQLLTLGVDDLAQKLNVQPSKLNTMTLVELTTYLSEFIENSKQSNNAVPTMAPPPPPIPIRPSLETPVDSPVFKVSFDDAVFEAKFDDNFGELQEQSKQQQHEETNSFVANFDNFNQAPVSVIPTADRYAVFREIIDQEIQKHQSFDGHQESIESNNSNSLEEIQEGGSFDFTNDQNQNESPQENQFQQSPIPYQTQCSSKLDNKITEALSGVKDRYAALRELRNIVLVEDLFDKSPKPPLASISDSNLSDEICDDASSSNQGFALFPTSEIIEDNSMENIPTYNISWTNDEVPTETIENIVQEEEQQQQQQSFEDERLSKINNTLNAGSNKDDLEIDEYMNKAISELSLDQRISPNIQNKSPSIKAEDDETLLKPSLTASTECKTSAMVSIENKSSSPIASSLVIKTESSNEAMNNEKTNSEITEKEESREKTITPVKPIESSESWAVFEDTHIQTKMPEKSNIGVAKADFESGSSDAHGKMDQSTEKDINILIIIIHLKDILVRKHHLDIK